MGVRGNNAIRIVRQTPTGAAAPLVQKKFAQNSQVRRVLKKLVPSLDNGELYRLGIMALQKGGIGMSTAPDKVSEAAVVYLNQQLDRENQQYLREQILTVIAGLQRNPLKQLDGILGSIRLTGIYINEDVILRLQFIPQDKDSDNRQCTAQVRCVASGQLGFLCQNRRSAAMLLGMLSMLEKQG